MIMVSSVLYNWGVLVEITKQKLKNIYISNWKLNQWDWWYKKWYKWIKVWLPVKK